MLTDTEHSEALNELYLRTRDIVDRIRTKIIEHKGYLHIPDLAPVA